jgi:hypothetical protein
MNAYTNLEQSIKLAKILPVESADMWYQYTGISIKDGSERPIYFPMVIRDCKSDKDIPCWSLVALFGVLPTFTIDRSDNHYYRFHCMERFTEWYDNPIDACVAMIERLRKLKMI